MNAKAEMIGEIYEQINLQHEPPCIVVYMVRYCDDDLCFHTIEELQYWDEKWVEHDQCGGSWICDDEGAYEVVNHGFKQHWDLVK